MALAGVAQGASQVVTKRTTLPPHPLDLAHWQDHLRVLSESYAASARAAVDQADGLRDKDTSDLFTAISRDR